jgi:hypothetical protein
MATRKRTSDQFAECTIRRISAEATAESKKLLKHMSAIYRVDPYHRPEQFGTGVYLCICDHYFLLTAAHVLDDLTNSTLYIAGYTTNELIALEGESLRSVTDDGSRDNDRSDIGICRLGPDLVTKIGAESFLPVSMVDVDDTGDAGATYIAMGYPAKKNTRLNYENKSVKRHPFSYTTKVLVNNELIKMGFHNSSHILVGYKKRHSRDSSGRDTTAPNPFGMSGGPLWRFKTYSGKSFSRLVGILIEWKKESGGILAVRLPAVLASIARGFPELGPSIPKATTVQVRVALSGSPEE